MFSVGNIYKISVFLLILAVTSKADEFDWYSNFLSKEVAPAYVVAYKTLMNKIINPLVAYNSEQLIQNETNVTGVVSLAEGLTCATKELYNSLSTALNASEQLNTILEDKLLVLISNISKKENETQQVSNQLSTIEARLIDAQEKVNAAENDVKNKENELTQADVHLIEEQNKRKIHLHQKCV